MKVLVAILVLVAVSDGNVRQLKSGVHENQVEESKRVKRQGTSNSVLETYRTMFDLLELAAFADMSDEAMRAVAGTNTAGVQRGGPNEGFGPRSRTTLPDKIDVFQMLKNEQQGKAFINRYSESNLTILGTAQQKKLSAVMEEGSRRVRKVKDLRVRKAYRCMTRGERLRYHAAVNKLKNTPVGSTNAHDVFTIMHNSVVAPAARFGPAFLPWSRHFLWMYEEALRQMDPTVTLPYWDSSVDARLSDPLQSVIWKSSHLGNPQGPVTSGPFANWKTPEGNTLRREVTGNKALLYNDVVMASVFKPDNFNDYWGIAEAEHAKPHVYVGGHMGRMPVTTADPLFFMHHAYVDCLWEEWREQKQYPTNRENEYPADAGLEVTQRKGSRMLPFRVNNGYGLNRVYTKLYYKCHQRNTCPNKQCGCDRYSRDCVLGRGGALDKLMNNIQPEWLRGYFLKFAQVLLGFQRDC